MSRFEPFAAVRYDPARVDLANVVAPPYDVIDDADLSRYEARSPYNVVHVDRPRMETGDDPYRLAAERFDRWLTDGVLATDPEPGFYAYRMGYHDDHGRPRQTSGVVGTLGLSVPGEGDVLPHERTLSKPKDDRLNLMRACRANLSPVWVLSLGSGLSALCEPAGPPLARCTDEQGVHHRLWRLTQPGVVEAVQAAVASAPVVIADGHHRYETALAYREERRAANSGRAGDYDLIMAYVVELTDEQLTVRPIHRLVSELPFDLDLVEALSACFQPEPADAVGGDLAARLAHAEGPLLVWDGGSWVLRPRQSVDSQPDSVLLEEALAELPPHTVAFHHDAGQVLTRLRQGEAQAGVLLRPPSVAQIAATAQRRARMPEKTTFFHPKPRTGMLFRRLHD